MGEWFFCCLFDCYFFAFDGSAFISNSAIITLIHGLIHLMGFTKAFNYAEINQLTQPISKMKA